MPRTWPLLATLFAAALAVLSAGCQDPPAPIAHVPIVEDAAAPAVEDAAAGTTTVEVEPPLDDGEDTWALGKLRALAEREAARRAAESQPAIASAEPADDPDFEPAPLALEPAAADSVVKEAAARPGKRRVKKRARSRAQRKAELAELRKDLKVMERELRKLEAQKLSLEQRLAEPNASLEQRAELEAIENDIAELRASLLVLRKQFNQLGRRR